MNMVETIAKAIFETSTIEELHWADPKRYGWKWEDCTDFTKEIWITTAKAAIAAMREPTADMLHTGACYGENTVTGIRNIWEEMIDTALAEDGKDG